ncbi:DUF4062 domain-containing protein [Acinetobacter sp. ANC 5584]
MSNDKKYQVFISSTYTDLIEARQAAINAVLESYNFPVGMEMFGADNDEQWAIIKDAIDVSDFYILILGHRYGSISKEGISYTEKEFDYAISKGVKAICFVRNEMVATIPTERETDAEKITKLNAFRTKVLADRVCVFWDEVEDLNQKISASLFKTMQRHGGIGWVRGNQASGQLAEEIAKLSEENRTLRDENERLKQSIQVKLPILKLSINEINESEGIEIVWKHLLEENMYKKPEKISSSHVNNQVGNIYAKALRMGLPGIDKYIQEYNNDVDKITEVRIQKHNAALRELEQLTSGSFNPSILLKNVGNAIANKISVEIEVPDFIRIIDDASDDDIKAYKQKIENNLIPDIKSPEKRHMEYLTPNVFGIGSIIPKLGNTSFLRNSCTKNNKIYISDEVLLHTKSIHADEYYFIPLAIGKGVIKVNIICAEYSEPEYFEIPISVIE